jgi:hypothetical protein
MRSRNVHISGTILQALVKELTKMLGKNKQNVTAVTMKNTIFGDVLPHSMVEMAVYLYQIT